MWLSNFLMEQCEGERGSSTRQAQVRFRNTDLRREDNEEYRDGQNRGY